MRIDLSLQNQHLLHVPPIIIGLCTLELARLSLDARSKYARWKVRESQPTNNKKLLFFYFVGASLVIALPTK